MEVIIAQHGAMEGVIWCPSQRGDTHYEVVRNMAELIETRGVGTVPDAERTAKPSSMVQVYLGANLSLSVMVFGWLAILYGLGFWESVSAIVVGTVLGALFVSRTARSGGRRRPTIRLPRVRISGFVVALSVRSLDC